MRHTRRQLDALRERLAELVASSVDVILFEQIDAQGRALPTPGYNCASLRVWLPAADAVDLVERIAPNGLHMLLAADTPAQGHVALPARDPDESLATYAERCRMLLP